MRPAHPLEIALAILVVVPNVVFSLACVPPGCGTRKVPPPPAHLEVDAEAPFEASEASAAAGTGDTGRGDTGDTGAPPAPEACGGPPSLALYDAETFEPRQPLSDEIAFTYGVEVANCEGPEDGGIEVAVAPVGLLPGPLDVGWTVRFDGREKAGATTWDAGCTAEGLASGILSIRLPAAADGADVELAVEVTDAAGAVVSATHAFRATVTDG